MKRLASFLGCPPWMQPKATLSPAWTTACCGPLLSLWWFVHNILVPGAKKWTWHSRYSLRSSEQRWQSLAFRSLLAMPLLMQPGGCWPSISVAGPCWPCPAAHRASGCSAELLFSGLRPVRVPAGVLPFQAPTEFHNATVVFFIQSSESLCVAACFQACIPRVGVICKLDNTFHDFLQMMDRKIWILSVFSNYRRVSRVHGKEMDKGW